ncbi:hypothetical protein ACFTRD_14130 [Paenibacillus sp. NPDC056933]|uniref:hypothetical protein n=1 Tax=Paenibacillus sp. NPDC056933 TaxID=3345968 RepID=UPI00362BE37A
MNNKYSKNNDIVRAALYLEYEGNCFYEGMRIRFNDMHIDHIIPESISKESLQDIISCLGLPEDFNVNSLYNLVPCSPNVNQVKNKNQYPTNFLGHCIFNETSKKVEGVKKRIDQLSKEFKSDKDVARLIARLNISDNKRELENVYNALSKEKPFDIKRVVEKRGRFYSFERSFSNVRLAGQIPTYPDMKGNCMITFSNLRLRDCMITLSHSQIMEQLFEGAHTDLNNKLRSFIIYSEEIDPDIYYVTLVNIRLPLEKDEVIQMLEIIDDFYDLYMEECKKFYEVFRRDFFINGDKKKNDIRLFKIKKDLWYLIREFSRKFDYENGNSDWHIFDAHGSILKVYDQTAGDFRVFIFPQSEQVEYFVYNEDEVWLVWTDDYFINSSLESFKTNHHWGPFFTYQWLINELIPQVMYWHENQNKKVLKKQKSLNEFKNSFLISDYVSFLHESESNDKLSVRASDLQEFFHIRPHNVYQIKGLSKVYECLIEIINKSNLSESEFYYISGKLGVREFQTKELLIQGISELMFQSEQERVISSSSLDLIYRCMVVVLRDCNNSMNDHDRNQLIEKLQFQYDLLTQERIREEI